MNFAVNEIFNEWDNLIYIHTCVIADKDALLERPVYILELFLSPLDGWFFHFVNIWDI